MTMKSGLRRIASDHEHAFGHMDEGMFPGTPTSQSPEDIGEETHSILEDAPISNERWEKLLLEIEDEKKHRKEEKKITYPVLF